MTTKTVALTSDVCGIGAGPKLLILHGLLGAARNWMAIAKRLGADHEVHALDLRNHGRSPWAEGMDYRALATDVAAYIDQHKLGAPIVVGHSMGGKVAMALALEASDRVGRLVVADIAPVAYERGGRTSFLDYIDAMAALDLAAVERRADADRALAEAIPDRAIRGFLLQNLVPDTANSGFCWRCNLQALSDGMADIIGFPEDLLGSTYMAPTLFLTGADSNYVRREHRPLIKGLFPSARF
ncbi:MAG: alpha/beta fold hydrolase, partial [Alphaproteobacteria bacterium]